MHNQFLERLGFIEDPFASTNAAGEHLLDLYFVDPPYFDSVVGDPRSPTSHIVLAPRGGGKTAQKRRLESIAPEAGFFCISYDEFELPPGFTLRDADWHYHVTQICRRLTVGILAFLHEEPSYGQVLTKHQKQLLSVYADWFVGPLSLGDFRVALGSVRSMPHRIKRVLDQYGGPVSVFVRAVLARLDVGDAPAEDQVVPSLKPTESLRYHLDRLAEIVQSLDFYCTYILVDRVDELNLTNNDAKHTFAFVRALLADLRTLETPGLAFKFFLWDETRPYIEEAVRTDRIHMDVLSWSSKELEHMLSRRLRAHSQHRVQTIEQLACANASAIWDPIIALLAHGSPREMIVLMRRVIAEQTRTSVSGSCIEVSSFWSAVRRFSDTLVASRAGKYLDDLRKIGASGRITFGSAEIANEVLRISQRATASKVQSWQRTGVIAQIGTLPNPGRRPPYLYGPADLRVAIAMMANTPPEETLEWNALICHGCEQLVITDRSLPCPSCQAELEYGEANTVISAAQRPAASPDVRGGLDTRLPTVRKIVHITTPQAWRAALDQEEYANESLRSDGFIHCATRDQVEDAANRKFAGTGSVLLLVIDPTRLQSSLIYGRRTRDGEETPRILGPINLDAVQSTVRLRERQNGFVLPESLNL